MGSARSVELSTQLTTHFRSFALPPRNRSKSAPDRTCRSGYLLGMAEKSQRRSIAESDGLMNEGQISGSHFVRSNDRFVGGTGHKGVHCEQQRFHRSLAEAPGHSTAPHSYIV